MTLLDLATLGLRALYEFTRDDDAFDDLIERLDALEGDQGQGREPDQNGAVGI